MWQGRITIATVYARRLLYPHALQVVIGWGNGSIAHGSCISRKGRGPTRELMELMRRCYARVKIIDE